jgi:8-oxo-dGTP pyrophosphatase MutT (NUDIX family)
LRAVVDPELILLPSVSVLVHDRRNLVLLVRHHGFGQLWAVPGGAVEVGESPAVTAVREVGEELGVQIDDLRLLEVLGGPPYQVTYPNGDQVGYVTAVYRARLTAGVPTPDGVEVVEVAGFAQDHLSTVELNRFSRALLTAVGYLPA